ncbi:hypothetical protein CRI94_00950 [Longibacter salinarum]|uniref:Haemolysin activator HlyB C-terminal domain-containing protein n=1 Tax=Longibacter salinarum TaxID=1850348 RepID=A0A2A8D1Z0_9BACT|nr:hypothetical protein [Longibacter salinarum]PEN14894.1 hypothetical protein CRI94_00950 [Longibacter salinarum]
MPISLRTLRAALLAIVVVLCFVPAVQAQVPVKPGIERAGIEIKRGLDIVQPPSVFYKRVLRNAARPIRVDSLGILRVPRPQDLDAIQYRDRSLGFAINLQHAMVVSDGQIVDVDVSNQAVRGTSGGTDRIEEEVIILRPPPEDAFDVAIPDGLECVELKPGSAEDVASRGRLHAVDGQRPAPCKQVQGVETVIDVAAWYDASMTNALTGVRARSQRFHNARELRGWLKSRAPGGEQVRFILVATPPAEDRIVFRERPGVDNLPLQPINVNVTFTEVSESGFEWITTLAGLGGPNRSDLPGAPGPRYSARRFKGDAMTAVRWNVSPNQRYEIQLFGSTQAAISDEAPGNHHDVPYGMSLAARFGERNATGFEIRIEGSYEDDPFQRNTLRRGDQRIRVLGGFDHGHLLTSRTQWHLAAGPTYFVDRVNIWEVRDDGRQLGYTVDAAFHRNTVLFRLPSIFSVAGQLYQSFGYVQDTGNSNLTVRGRIAAKPRFIVGGTMLALGPVAHVEYTDSDYADIPGFSETNVQVGLEVTSWITF